MLPTSASKSHSEQRRKPLTSKTPIARSNSLFGAIKNIVTAPLSWFGSTDDFEDTKGKRRRLPQSSAQSREEDEGTARTKRIRVNSPDRDMQSAGYLDPPGSVFGQQQQRRPPTAVQPQPRQTRSPARRYLRASSATIPTSSTPQSPRNRHTLSPYPSGSHLKPEGISRTMSLDPPSGQGITLGTSLIQRQDTMQDLTAETRNASRKSMSISRDVSMSPNRHLRMRTSLTPQPSGATVNSAHERKSHEPPPLASLMSNPIFVKPPPGLQKSDSTTLSKQTTLGSLMESQRSSRSPVRQRGSLLFGSGSMQDVSGSSLRPMNAAEKVLQELDVYKTPLLPTRLKGSSAIPEMFMPKQSRSITLMRDERSGKPRLGMKIKGKKARKQEEVNMTKPYAGEGGMKKLLARRKREEEQAREREREDAMEDDYVEEEKPQATVKIGSSRKHKDRAGVPTSLQRAEPRFDSNAGREVSSLRVGRTRIARSHISRPVSRSNNRFSAIYDEDEEDSQTEEARIAEQNMLEEAAKKAPVFEIPAGFTFAKDIPPVKLNSVNVPTSTLPFSIARSTTPAVSVTAAAVTPLFAVPQSTEGTSKPAPAEETPARPTSIPTISLVPPTPQPAKPDTYTTSSLSGSAPSNGSAPPTTSGIPNFFANSAVLSKPPATVNMPPLSFGAVPLPVPAKDVENPVLQGETKENDSASCSIAEPKLSLFGNMGGPSSTSTQTFSMSSSNNAPILAFGLSSSSAATSLFGQTAATPAPKESSAASQEPKDANVFASSKPEITISSPFSFAQGNKSSESAMQSVAQPELRKAAASFGTTAVDKAKPTSQIETVTPTSAFSFDPSGKAAEAPKNAFSFGQPTASVAPSSPAPATEAQKPLFGGVSSGFSFGPQPTATTVAEEKPASNSFSFGSAPSTPSAPEKKAAAFSFGTPGVSTPLATSSFMFGTPSSNTNASDVSSKSFSFGQTAPVRATTPPKDEQEVQMEESPTREMNMNGNEKLADRPTLGFSFGTSGSSMEGTSGRPSFGQNQTSSPGFNFGTPAANPFGAKAEAKTENKPAPSFGGFGQSLTIPGFSFGSKPTESPVVPSPNAAPSFSFGQSSPNAAPSSPFGFGAPPNVFGQSSVSPASAPASPSPFNQPQSTPFSFGAPAAAPSNTGFAFGASSQPASPAAGNNLLPQSATSSGGFTFGQQNGSATTATPTASSFGAPPPSAGGGGGALFTIGSAPPPPPAGGRQIKKLPMRKKR